MGSLKEFLEVFPNPSRDLGLHLFSIHSLADIYDSVVD